MTEAHAKKLLRRILRSLTTGSVLHLLAELFRESLDQTQPRAADKARDVATTLFVTGLGIDAVCPHLPEKRP